MRSRPYMDGIFFVAYLPMPFLSYFSFTSYLLLRLFIKNFPFEVLTNV